jgi:hypothetical protein
MAETIRIGTPGCPNCQFWEALHGERLRGNGLCRRHAPVRQWSFATDALEAAMGRVTRVSWPITNEHDWCGEYVTAREKADA